MPHRNRIPIFLAFALALFAGACSSPSTAPGGDGNGNGAQRARWDTSFSIRSVAMGSDSVLGRAILDGGDGGRLRGFFSKLGGGGEVRLGFIGGSITQGARASGIATRYANRLAGFLAKAWPSSRFKVIDAGIGATDSRFGASRLKGDLLDSLPDLIVLEYAVNDDAGDTALYTRTLEGMIRQCLATAPGAPVVVFQTLNRAGDSLTQIAQTRLARHYGLPVVSYRNAVWPLLAEGRIAWTDLSADDVHPNDAGHLLCGYLLYRFLSQRYADLGSGPPETLAMPTPLADDLYEGAAIAGPSTASIRIDSDSGWTRKLDSHGRYSWTSSTPGARIALTLRARESTLQFRYAKDLDASLQVRVDGVETESIANHFEADWGGGYLKGARLFLDADPGPHRVELTLNGGTFSLDGLLFAP